MVTTEVLVLTEKAQKQIPIIFQAEAEKNSLGDKGLRVKIVGGGCSGLSYQMDFDLPKEKDLIQEYQGFKVLIDPKSAVYLKGVTLDFQDGLKGKGFIFQNPHASNTCGCGESFSI